MYEYTPKTERNHQIWKEYTVLGMTQRAIAEKHGITQKRVWSILQRENKKLKNAAGRGGGKL